MTKQIKLTPQDVDQQVEKAEQELSKRYHEIAEKVFQERVEPYCKRYKLDFVAGNGSWAFLTTDKTKQSYVDSHVRIYPNLVARECLPEEMVQCLEVGIFLGKQDLGSYAPCYFN